MRRLALVALGCAAFAAGCSVTSSKSHYPKQYAGFKAAANDACDDLFYGLDTNDRGMVLSAVRRLLRIQAPPDLQRRWVIYQGDIRRYFLASKVVSDRAAQALD